MQILSRKLPKTHELYLAGDIHNGSNFQHEDGVRQLIDAVGGKRNRYLALVGDLAEAITIDDKRYSRSSENVNIPTPILQYRDLVQKFKPIAKKIVVALAGNHDLKIANRFGDGVKDIFCKELGVPYGGYTSKLAIEDEKGALLYKVFLSHGFGSIGSKLEDPDRREASKRASLKKLLMFQAGDCVIQCCGHSHQLIVRKPVSELYLTDNGKKIKHNYTEHPQVADYIPPDSRYFINTGCFYKLYMDGITGYAEMKGYVPNELGYAKVIVEDGKIVDVEKIVLE